MKHENRAKTIALNAISYYSRRLRQEDLICWMAMALQKTSEALAFKPEVAEGMEKLDLETSPGCSCK